jgi:hypothetical protein
VKFRSKRIGRRENIFQNKCALVPKTTVIRKEEGATAAASHLPSLSGPLRYFRLQAGPAASPRKHSTLQESPIKYHKCPTFDAKRDFQTFILIGPPKQMKQMKQKNAAESENRLKNTRM